MEKQKTGNWAIVVAAGSGTRMRLGFNKVFYNIMGRSCLARCIDAIHAAGIFEGIVVVLSKNDIEKFEKIRDNAWDFQIRTAFGGATRLDSIWNGYDVLPETAETLAITDAARCCTPPEMYVSCMRAARKYGCAIPVIGINDTLVEVGGGKINKISDRDAIKAAQTPMGYKREVLKAHYREKDALSNSIFSLLSGLGHKLHVIPGDSKNIKLTTKEDLFIMERILKRDTGAPRVGTGYDVHKLVPGRELILCGISIPHETGLDGHSDADVAVHALIDALLGAAGLGDIGRMFPDSDNKYKGISSIKLLKAAHERVVQAGYRLGNADITIIAQRPKLKDYIERMRECVAEALEVPQSVVNVKATTTEGLGFEGEERGISAHAVAVIL